MRVIFLEKLYTKFVGETILRAFPKKVKLSESLNQQPKVLYSLFLLYAKLLKLSGRPLAFTSLKKQKEVWN